jgi:hypothetical protein
LIYIEDIAVQVSGHSPLLNTIASWMVGGMLIYLILPDIGLLGLMWLRGQDLPQRPLKHLQLIPDSAERDFDPPQLNCSPLVIFLRFFPDMIFTTLLA